MRHESHSEPSAGEPRSLPGAVRLVDLLVWCVVLAGVFLLFHRLAWNGSTWDERIDYSIAQDIARHGNVLTNVFDPTQSRLPHMVGALALALFGDGLWAFKLPFAFIGLLGGALLYAFVARRRDRVTASYCLAFYLTNPWVLASSRSAATAGDILVVVTTFAFFWAAVRFVESHGPDARRLRHTMALGLLAGVSVGAKLTSAVLIPFGLAIVVATRMSLRHAVVFVAGSALFAVATHPLLMTESSLLVGSIHRALGPSPSAPDANRKVVRPMASSTSPFDKLAGKAPVYSGDVFLVSLERPPKLRYLWAVLAGKLTVPFLFVVLLGGAMGARASYVSRKFDPAFCGALLFVLATCGFIWKNKQNPNYFLPLLLPAITIAALPLATVLQSPKPWRRAAGSCAWLTLLVYQLWLCAALSPDYLQAGRRMGPSVQGLMAGPAVNHCQGTPLLIDRLNALRHTASFGTAYVLEACMPVIVRDATLGPVQPVGYSFVKYNPIARPPEAHLVVVHETLHYDAFATTDHTLRMRRLQRATRGCVLANANAANARFKVFRCPAAVDSQR